MRESIIKTTDVKQTPEIYKDVKQFEAEKANVSINANNLKETCQIKKQAKKIRLKDRGVQNMFGNNTSVKTQQKYLDEAIYIVKELNVDPNIYRHSRSVLVINNSKVVIVATKNGLEVKLNGQQTGKFFIENSQFESYMRKLQQEKYF